MKVKAVALIWRDFPILMTSSLKRLERDVWGGFDLAR
jgi:hypothetical protein